MSCDDPGLHSEVTMYIKLYQIVTHLELVFEFEKGNLIHSTVLPNELAHMSAYDVDVVLVTLQAIECFHVSMIQTEILLGYVKEFVVIGMLRRCEDYHWDCQLQKEFIYSFSQTTERCKANVQQKLTILGCFVDIHCKKIP